MCDFYIYLHHQSNAISFHCMRGMKQQKFTSYKDHVAALLKQIMEACMFPLPERALSVRRDVRKVTGVFPGISFCS